MELNAYQSSALKTDQVKPVGGAGGDPGVVIPLLGLAGEAGELLTEYKKYLRDGDAHRLFRDRVGEELGDLLWYISVVADRFNLSLEEVASRNLDKVNARWAQLAEADTRVLDAKYLPEYRLPRRFEIEICQELSNGRVVSHATVDGKPFGNELSDNAYEPNGYRFHDVLHFAHAAVLGWSPVTRAFLKRKRKAESDKLVDEVEDGGRAIAIEEGVVAVEFSYARTHDFLDGVTMVDYSLLRTVKTMTADLEVRTRTTGDWERAILQGFAAWRSVEQNLGGKLIADLDRRTLVVT